MVSDDEAFCSGDEEPTGACQQRVDASKSHLRQFGSVQRAHTFEPPSSSCSAVATMSASAHNAVTKPPLSASLYLSKRLQMMSNSGQGKRTASTQTRSSGPTLGRAQARLVFGTSGLAIWTFFIVFYMCNAMPDFSHGVRHDLGGETYTFVTFIMLLLVGVLLLSIMLAYGVVWPNSKGTIKCEKGSSSVSPVKMGRLGKACGQSEPEAEPATPDVEAQPVKQSCSSRDSSLPAASDDADTDGFVSCDELSDSEDAELPSGALSIVGFLVDKKKLPELGRNVDYEALVLDAHRHCSLVGDLSLDQCLRLCLGLNFDTPTVIKKWAEIYAWRYRYEMANERARCLQLQHPSETEAVVFPHQDEIYGKVFTVRPCALACRTGEPMSLWLVGTGSSSASSVPVEKVEEWSRSVFEYMNTWAQTQSQVTGRLLGQVQVFDMSGVGFRQIANKALHERFKCALGCGGNYVELVSHVYVINASWSFSKIWNIVKPMISKRTSAKVTVSMNVPDELLNLLNHDSSKVLTEILATSGSTAVSKVQRPPMQPLACV